MNRVAVEQRAIAPVEPNRRAGWRAWWAKADRGLVVLIALYVLSLPFVTHRITASDAIEYYSYDRSLYFDHDLNFFNDYQGFIDRNPRGLAGFRQPFLVIINDDGTETPNVTATGHAVNFGPIGSAILWAPFFVAGDLAARALRAVGFHVAVDGFSAPYIWAVSLGSAIWAGVALVLSYLLAKAITGARVAFAAAMVAWLGTPALFYSHLAPTYSHAPSWFAATLFLTIWYRTREARTWRGWLALGLAGGLMGLVREQDAVFVIVPAVDEALRLLPGLRRPTPLWWRDLGRTALGGIVMATAAFVAFIPQLAVYKTLYGDFRPSSDVSQKMHYNAPNGLRVLFNPEHGLFLWTPALLLAVIGLGLLIRRDARLGLALCTGLILTWYLNGAIQTWSTAGAFGARRFIVCTPIFAVGFAEAFRVLGTRVGAPQLPMHLRWWVPVFVAAAIYWNLGYITQFVLQSNGPDTRQRLIYPDVLVNQVTAVPVDLARNAWKVVANRDAFYQGGKGYGK